MMRSLAAAADLAALLPAPGAQAAPIPLNQTVQDTSPQAADIIPILPSPFTGNLQYATVQSLLALAPPSTPGGSNGQLQFNNAGAFGGFALTGDCALTAPNIACMKLNGVPAASYALLASPAFTGTPTVPTAAPNTNSTQAASTAYADAIAALKANLASPTFTGSPTAPTQALTDNSTRLATDAFVANGFCILTGCTMTGPINQSGAGANNFTNTSGPIVANFSFPGIQPAMQCKRTDTLSAAGALCEFNFAGVNSSGVERYFAVISASATNATPGAETGALNLAVLTPGQQLANGTLTCASGCSGYAVNDVIVLDQAGGGQFTNINAKIQITFFAFRDPSRNQHEPTQ